MDPSNAPPPRSPYAEAPGASRMPEGFFTHRTGTPFDRMQISTPLHFDHVHRSKTFSGIRLIRKLPEFSVQSPGLPKVVVTVWEPNGSWSNRSFAGRRSPDAVFGRNCVSVVPPGADWNFDLSSDGGADFNFFIDPGKFDDLFGDAMPAPGAYAIKPSFDATNKLLTQAARAYAAEFAKKDRFSAIALDSIALQVCLEIARTFTELEGQFRDDSGAATRCPRIRRAKEFILANLHEPIGLSEIAQAVGLSQYHFCRMFKKAVGKSPYQYVREQRLSRAADLLRTTDLAIAEIAFACGFSSQQHLTTVFAGRFNMPPGQWRRLRQKD